MRAVLLLVAGCGVAGIQVTDADDLRRLDIFSPFHPDDLYGVDARIPVDMTEVFDASASPDLKVAPDLATLADLSAAPDLRIFVDMTPVQIDFAFYPGCGAPGLPTGASCTANNQCCHVLCDSPNHLAPRTCCYAKGTNCQSNYQCCSGFCIGASQCN